MIYDHILPVGFAGNFDFPQIIGLYHIVILLIIEPVSRFYWELGSNALAMPAAIS